MVFMLCGDNGKPANAFALVDNIWNTATCSRFTNVKELVERFLLHLIKNGEFGATELLYFHFCIL